MTTLHTLVRLLLVFLVFTQNVSAQDKKLLDLADENTDNQPNTSQLNPQKEKPKNTTQEKDDKPKQKQMQENRTNRTPLDSSPPQELVIPVPETCPNNELCKVGEETRPCFDHGSQEPNEKALIKTSDTQTMSDPDDETFFDLDYEEPIVELPCDLTGCDEANKNQCEPDESMFFRQENICSPFDSRDNPDPIDFPSLEVEEPEVLFDEEALRREVENSMGLRGNNDTSRNENKIIKAKPEVDGGRRKLQSSTSCCTLVTLQSSSCRVISKTVLSRSACT